MLYKNYLKGTHIKSVGGGTMLVLESILKYAELNFTKISTTGVTELGGLQSPSIPGTTVSFSIWGKGYVAQWAKKCQWVAYPPPQRMKKVGKIVATVLKENT